ncbi:putative F-box protein [Cardamine amara subsp. amara]|uniref:F-box protein n=1 Tax=Cardamine amara subsp. amara TaxID=228776 RepID=A0ABD0ZC84_CARAN
MQMFTSRNMSWTQVVGHPNAFGVYQDIVAFKGKFYVVDSSGWGQVFAIDLSSEVTEIPSVRGSPHKSDQECLVKSGEELLLVQWFTPINHFRESMYTWFRVFKLDEEEGRMIWVQVNDLNDRVIFLGRWWSLCCSVQKLLGARRIALCSLIRLMMSQSFCLI